jgi:hypothetical protein
VSWLEGDYLTLRPSFSDAQSAYAYRTEIRWDDACSSLMFRESERLDAAFTPQRSTAGNIDGELLAGTPIFDSTVAGPAAAGQKLVVSGVRFEPLWPDIFSPEQIDVVAMLNVGTTPLASTPARVTRSAPGAAVGPARAQVAFADRVLLFGSGFSLSTTVVWLR